ncbi:type II toxin-antitoxin system HipA family toxin [Agromyces marinus]|uniref:Toxin HipA n=1 Tax=Agromyces marinus TaxID=1389020 RepID=A0ABM8H3P0_9MICO|nr:type II toxin-antitoxin system HipA family toxin [Agromyces marinus]UIP59537.1 Serine/threonine-protein kinase toxin HipA [Agromyces marinus]BDZ55406.1 toxin HipA [Agromyces marinus]
MRLTAYLNGTRVGWFEQLGGGTITLEYDRAWQQRASRIELSLSVPKSRRVHTGAAPGNYLWNLLPDNTDVLERWGRQFGVSARNPMALLANVGLDAAGAVQLVASGDQDDPELSGEGGVEHIDEAGIAAHLRTLRRDPSAWIASDYDGGYFSLAGAQSKFTLTRTPDGWGVPTGRSASTHIVKPGVSGLARSDLNEHLTMRAAHFLGLTVALSRVERFEDETSIVITRFDRARTADGTVIRLHQEDFAQATGTHPSAKYQNEGGPGIAAIGELMRENLGRPAFSEVERFFEATLFNWAVLGTDAHAKNYALTYSGTRSARPVLAPLYDLGSALAYPEINNRRAKLAMSYGGHYRASEIEPRHLVREAAALGLTEEWVLDRARHLVHGLPEALGRAIDEAKLTGDDALFAAMLSDRARERTNELGRQLARRL